MTLNSEGPRIAIIGNAGGGKSTLARGLAKSLDIPHVEIDCLLWRADWTTAPQDAYEKGHAQAIAKESWIVDGLGRRESISERLGRTTAIILVDMPIWMHFWLAAERQMAWNDKAIEHPPAGVMMPPPTEALFRTIFEVDRDWMPELRDLVERDRWNGKPVVKIASVDELRQGVEPECVAGSAKSG